MAESAALLAFDAVTERGHVMYDAPSLVQHEDGRWDCKVCDCYLWVRQYGEPYGTALTAPCSTRVGRGRVDCDGCGLSWAWPGTFADEAAARAYLGEHACGRNKMQVTVLTPNRP